MCRFSVRKAYLATLIAAPIAVLMGGHVPAQVPSDSAPQSMPVGPEALEVFRAPRPLKIKTPKCDIPEPTGGRLVSKDTSAGCLSWESQINNNEGWVVLNFMVDTNGKPFEVTVTQSTGNKYFEQGAVSAIQDSTFEPGTLNGRQIESGYEMKYKFSDDWMKNSPGASRKFIDSYKALANAIAKGDRDAADLAMQNLKISNLYEDAYFGVAKYSYAKKWGTESEQLAGLLRAIANEGDARYLPTDMFKGALLACLKLELSTHRYAEALSTAKDLQKLADIQTTAALTPIVAQVNSLRTDGSEVEVAGVLSETTWLLHLFKRHFRAVVSDGQLSEFKLRCDKRYVYFAFDPKLNYEVAKDFGACTIELDGAPGTHFKLIQF